MLSLIDVLLHLQCLFTAKEFFTVVSTCKRTRDLPHGLSFVNRTFYELSREIVTRRHPMEVVGYSRQHTSLFFRRGSDLRSPIADDADCIAYEMTMRIIRMGAYVDEIQITVKVENRAQRSVEFYEYVTRHEDGGRRILPKREYLLQY